MKLSSILILACFFLFNLSAALRLHLSMNKRSTSSPESASNSENTANKFRNMPKNLLLKSYTNNELRSPPNRAKKVVAPVEIAPTPVEVIIPSVFEKTVVLKDAEGVPAGTIKARRPIVSGGSGRKRIMTQGERREREIMNPNKLRILGGTAKGKKIDSPSVYLRPMMGKVREALFSTLKFMDVFIANSTRVLDTFCGSGSVGLEALSRGAAYSCFVDLSPDCTSTAMKNLNSCGFSGQGQSVCCRTEDALRFPSKYGLNEPFQLITITPPYEEVVYSDLIDAVCNSPLIEPDTVVVIEYPIEMGTLPFILGVDKLYGVRNRRYGRTVLGIYVYRPNKKYDMRPDEFNSI